MLHFHPEKLIILSEGMPGFSSAASCPLHLYKTHSLQPRGNLFTHYTMQSAFNRYIRFDLSIR